MCFVMINSILFTIFNLLEKDLAENQTGKYDNTVPSHFHTLMHTKLHIVTFTYSLTLAYGAPVERAMRPSFSEI